MPRFSPAEVHQRALDHSTYLPDGRLVWWENKVDGYAYLYRAGLISLDEYEALGGDPGKVPPLEELVDLSEELDANLGKLHCSSCNQILPPTGEAEISYCLNCGAAG